MHNIAPGTVKVIRTITAGRSGPDIPPVFGGPLIGGEDGSVSFDDPDTGESFSVDTTGGILLHSHTSGQLQGTIKLNGQNVLPEMSAFDVQVTATLQFSCRRRERLNWIST